MRFEIFRKRIGVPRRGCRHPGPRVVREVCRRLRVGLGAFAPRVSRRRFPPRSTRRRRRQSPRRRRRELAIATLRLDAAPGDQRIDRAPRHRRHQHTQRHPTRCPRRIRAHDPSADHHHGPTSHRHKDPAQHDQTKGCPVNDQRVGARSTDRVSVGSLGVLSLEAP